MAKNANYIVRKSKNCSIVGAECHSLRVGHSVNDI